MIDISAAASSAGGPAGSNPSGPRPAEPRLADSVLAGSGLADSGLADSELDQLLAGIGEVWLSAATAQTALQIVTKLAVETIPSSVGAGITLADDGGALQTIAATDPIVEAADAWQYRLGAGPCVTAWRDRASVRIDDVAVESRWPKWCRAAVRLGVSSVLSAPLAIGPTTTGAIKLYADTVGAFDDRSGLVVGLLADHASLLTQRDA